MNKDFDFDDIGKQTPCRTPDGFFEQMQDKVLKRTLKLQRRKRKVRMIISTTLTLAALFIGFLFAPSIRDTETDTTPSSKMLTVETVKASFDQSDQWINELSDEELEELVNFSANDLFIN